MASTIRLTETIASGRRDLRFFAGRSLGENEFDLMQAYVAERCDVLLLGSRPGIISGLSVIHDGQGAGAVIRVQSGLALGGDGRAIRVLAPITVDWTAIIEEFKTRTRTPDAPETPLNGWFHLTVKRGVMIIEPETDAKPATRTDLDILRDSRVETLATLDLQPVSTAPSLLTAPAKRAINRLQAANLTAAPFDRTTGAVPLALLKVTNDELAIEDGEVVVDEIAGRFLAIEDAAHATFLAGWSNEVQRLDKSQRRISALRAKPIFRGRSPAARLGGPAFEIARQPLPGLRRAIPAVFEPVFRFNASRPLSEQLGVDFLPAAGPFPEGLIERIAGRPKGTGWSLPDLRFDPLDLQIEIAPIRSSQVDEMIAREMARGVIDLVNVQGDRIRVLLAVDDRDFSGDLMNLPETDPLLNSAVYIRAMTARTLWQAWADLYGEIFAGLDNDIAVTDDMIPQETEALFRGLRIPPPPSGAFPRIEALPVEQEKSARKHLGVAPTVAPPPSGGTFFANVIGREANRAAAAKRPLPRPYAQGVPSPPEDLVTDTPIGLGDLDDGLYRQRADLLEEIRWLEEELDGNDRLVADFDVFIRAQRQQVDSITVSFTALAGGVPGDGSGLQLAKWAPFTKLDVKPDITPSDD